MMMTHSMYSILFSFVTGMSSPPGFSGTAFTSPKDSSSAAKTLSMTSVMSLSLVLQYQ